MRRIKRRVRRACGECSACCWGMEITALDKPAGEICPSQACGNNADDRARLRGGCSTYDKRPIECGAYRCGWLGGAALLDRQDRPDRIGVILGGGVRGSAFLIMEVFELWPGATEIGRGARMINRLRQHKGLDGVYIVRSWSEDKSPRALAGSRRFALHLRALRRAGEAKAVR